MNSQNSHRLEWWTNAFPRMAGATVATIGASAIVGWTFTIPILMSVHPDLISMKANAAIGLIMSGVSMLLLSTKRETWRVAAAMGLACVVCIIGFLTVAEYAFGWDAGIDQLIFNEEINPENGYPGRMVFTTAVSFCMLGLSLLAIGQKPRWSAMAAHILALLVGLGGLLALLSYIYGLSDFFAYGLHTRMALNTAISFILLVLGIFCLQHTVGFARVFFGSGSGSFMARRLIPAAVVVPVALAWLVGQGEALWYGDQFADVLTAATGMIILVSLVWLIGRSLNEADREREDAEHALRASEERYRLLIENLAEGVAMVDREEKFAFVNSAAETIFGVPSGSLAGRSMREFVDQNEFVRIQEQSELRLKGETSKYGIQIIRPDGVKCELRVSVSPLYDKDGGYIGALGILRDISEYKSVQDKLMKFRKAIDTSGEAILLTDKDGTITFVNSGFTATYGYTAEEVVGKVTPRILKSGMLGMDVYKTLWERLLNGKGVRGELQNKRKDGTLIDVEGSIDPIIDENNEITGFLGIQHDITKRKRAEAALQNERLLLRTLIDNIPDSIYSKDLECRKTLTNAADLSHMGAASESEVLGRDDSDFYPKELAEGFLANDRSVMRTGEPILNNEEYIFNEKGQKRWLLSSKIPLRDREGRVIGLVGIGRDITERKQAEETIKRSLALLETIIESIDNGILVVSREGKVLKFNGRFAEMWRIPSEILAGNEDEKMLAYILDQLVDPDAFISKVKALYDELTAESFDVLSFKDGRVFERVSRPLLVAGEPQGRAWSFRDITERKRNEEMLIQSEDRYRTIVENVGEGICFVDSGEQFILANGAAEEIFGVEPGGLIGKNLGQFVAEKQQRPNREAMAPNLQGDKSAYELEIVRPTGVKRNIIITAVAQNDKVTGFLGTLGVFRDITDRKMIEQELRNAQKMESLGIVAGGIAHDYNNLLAIMIGNVSLARQRLPIDHPSMKNIEKALSTMQRAALLTKQMLAYSGKGMFAIQTCDIGDIIQRQMPAIKASMSKNVELDARLPSMPVCVSGDPGQIKQIVMNLIANGNEAIGEAPGIITFTVTEVTLGGEELVPYSRITKTPLHEGRYALIGVQDTGGGMDKATMEKIFDPFFTTKFIGRGLGLSAVFGIIQSHKGGIVVESNQGAGTLFNVILPVIPAPEQRREEPR